MCSSVSFCFLNFFRFFNADLEIRLFLWFIASRQVICYFLKCIHLKICIICIELMTLLGIIDINISTTDVQASGLCIVALGKFFKSVFNQTFVLTKF